MTESEMRGRAIDIRIAESDRADFIERSTERNKEYVKTILIKNLDIYISAVELTLELAKISYTKRTSEEKSPQRKLRTKYLTDLLVRAEEYAKYRGRGIF